VSEQPAPPSALHALVVLSRLRLAGHLRKLGRSLKTPKGALMVLALLGLLVVSIVPRIAISLSENPQTQARMPNMVHPAMLLLLWIGSWFGMRWTIGFSMAEVDFLFPGPFSRRQLQLYKLSLIAMGALYFALLSPVFVVFAWWPALMVGVFLYMLFMQWTAIALDLTFRWAATRFALLPYLVIAVLLGAAVGNVWQAGVLDVEASIPERLERLNDTLTARIVLAPFTVFSRTIGAWSFEALATWASASLAIVLAVAACIVRLDRYFIEASLHASRRRYQALERMKASGGRSAQRLKERPRITLPDFPRLAGLGTIAWRQSLETLRRNGGLLMAVVVPIGIGAAAASIPRFAAEAHIPAIAILLGIVAVIALLITTSTQLGMRADLEHIEALKSLPLGSAATVGGSLAAGVFYLFALQAIATVTAAVALGGHPLIAIGALAVAIPLNLLLIGGDSILVLLFPSTRVFVPSDPFAGLRLLVVSIVKMAMVLVAAGVTAAVALIAQLLVTDAPAVLIGIAAGVLLVEGLLAAWVATVLFERFDPSANAADGE